MAVECKTNCCTPTEHDYPMIMKSKDSGVIVLFSAPRHGTVLRRGWNGGLKTGERFTDWYMGSFEPVSGDIILRNK